MPREMGPLFGQGNPKEPPGPLASKCRVKARAAALFANPPYAFLAGSIKSSQPEHLPGNEAQYQVRADLVL